MQKAYIRGGLEVINYTHFSLALNKLRRFAICVGWNVDGGNIKKVSRKGIRFVLDPDIPSEYQIGEQLYKVNRLDQGHIARRADLIWGELPVAKAANKDSFYFTNITPQMDDFNQSTKNGLWGRLEEAIFDDTDVENLKISVFGGPVFHDNVVQRRLASENLLIRFEYRLVMTMNPQCSCRNGDGLPYCTI